MLSRPFHGPLPGFFILFVVTALDQWSKAAILIAAQSGSIPREILPILNFVLVRNRGISFGLLGHMHALMPLLLTLATSAIALSLLGWLIKAQDAATALALGFVIGGATGNIADRIRLGAVTDFIDFHLGSVHFWTFNIADSAIFIGVVILVFISIVRPAKQEEGTA